MHQNAIIAKIKSMRAMAQMMEKEATSLEKLLADVSTPAVRKGLNEKQLVGVVLNRRKRLLKK